MIAPAVRGRRPPATGKGSEPIAPPPRSASPRGRGPQWRDLARATAAGAAFGAGIQGLAALALLAAGAVRFAPRAGDPEILATAVAELVAISAAQELVFRGWLLRALKRLGFWPAAILAGGAFVAVHLARPGETAAGLSGLFVFALLAAAGVRRAGTVAWAVGLHAGWNLVQDVVLGLPDGGLASRAGWLQAHLVGPAWLTGGGAGPEGGAPALLLMAVALLALGRIARPADRDTAPRRG